MKKFIGIIAISAVILSFTGCSPSEQSNNQQQNTQETQQIGENTGNDKLIVGLDDDFPPMGFRDENNEIVGFDIDLAKAAAEKMGVEIEFQPIDWNSKEFELDSGKVNLLWNGLTMTEDRIASMAFTDPYLKNKQIIMVKNDSDINLKSDLEGKTIGLQDGSSAVNAVEADEIKDKIKEISTYENNIQAFTDLNIGRLDAVVVDEIVAKYYLAKNDTDFRILDENFGDESYGVAAKKDNTQLIEKLQKALDELADDGTAAQISEKWFGENIYVN